MVRRLAWAALTGVVFLLGLLIGRISAPSTRTLLDVRRVDGREQSRVTDPTGRFDAIVLFETWGGAAGSVENWYVCIVRKGQPAASVQEAVVVSTSTRNQTVRWQQSHLLEVHYDRAEIMEFTNLSSTSVLKAKLFSNEEPYWIEVRLAPLIVRFLYPDARRRFSGGPAGSRLSFRKSGVTSIRPRNRQA